MIPPTSDKNQNAELRGYLYILYQIFTFLYISLDFVFYIVPLVIPFL